MKPAIVVEGLSKRYRITHQGERGDYKTLRESLAGMARGAARKFVNVGRTSDDGAEDFWALADVNFKVQPGEVVGIIGRNGAGKSTLLKILSRITKPTGGKVALNGRVGSLLEVGTGFHPELTGRENIYLNGSILGMSHREISQKFDEIVDFSGVEKFLDTPVKRYSSGMYVRLAFSVAAHLEPEILLVDEVLAVGDGEFQRKCIGKMQQVSKAGRTVLFVSHNVEVLRRLTARCILLGMGKVSADGFTGEILQQYQNQGVELNGGYCATGVPEHNRIEAASVRGSGGAILRDVVPWGAQISCEFVVNVIHPSDSLCFSFQIVNADDVAVTHFSSFNPVAGWGNAPGFYRLRCQFDRLRLFQGTYTITTWLADRRDNALAESVSSICPFAVDATTVGRGQYEWQRRDAVYLEDHNWFVEPIPDSDHTK